MINTANNPQPSHIIPSDEGSILYVPHITITTDIQPAPLHPTEDVSIQHKDSLVRGTINNIPLLVSTIIEYSNSPLSYQ